MLETEFNGVISKFTMKQVCAQIELSCSGDLYIILVSGLASTSVEASF